MGAGFSCKLNADKEKQWLAWLAAQLEGDCSAYDEVGKEAVQIIEIRTSGGQDVNGSRFRAKVDGNPSYLRKNGYMLGSVKHSRSRTKITITQDQPIYGAVHNFGLHAGRGKGFIMPVRQWFGLVSADISQLNDSLMRKLKTLFEKSMPR